MLLISGVVHELPKLVASLVIHLQACTKPLIPRIPKLAHGHHGHGVDLSGRDPVQFRGKSGRIAGVWTYQDGVATDYDVIIDEHEAQNARGCPGFEEQWLTLEAV